MAVMFVAEYELMTFPKWNVGFGDFFIFVVYESYNNNVVICWC